MTTYSDIAIATGWLFGVTPDLLFTAGRKAKRVTRARMALALALRRRGHSYIRIGAWTSRDHSSIIYQVKQALEHEACDPVFARHVEKLTHMKRVAPVMLDPSRNDTLQAAYTQ